mmetsp:Transcript_2093/g.6378  ORF Transcript_2093/g.6378 Transcript_2093/m.6378 type:complete len:359 (+) Transcript_2093:265-1341(+)
MVSSEGSLTTYERKQQKLEWMWQAAVVASTTLAFGSFVLADLCQGGLGTSNGRMVSFLNSLNSVASYRRQRRVLVSGSNVSTSPVSERRRSEVLYVRSPRNCLAHRVKLFSLNFLAKFGSQSLGSVLIGAKPVLLKGPRHTASWLLAFACIQLCPRDSVYTKLQSHPSLLLVVRVGCALYKLRKFNFLAHFALDNRLSLSWILAAQVVVIDGNNLCSRIWTWTWLRGYSQTAASDLLAALAAFVARCGPVALASFLVRAARLRDLHPALAVLLKLHVFALFLWRYDVPTLLKKTCAAYARRATPGPKHPPRILANFIDPPPLPSLICLAAGAAPHRSDHHAAGTTRDADPAVRRPKRE